MSHKYYIEEKSILKPIVFFKGYPITRSSMQKLIDDNEFIYSPTAFVEFLINLTGFKNTKGNPPNYAQVGQWKLNYHGRNLKLKENCEYSIGHEKLKLNQKAVEFCREKRESVHQFLLKELKETYENTNT